MGLVPWRQKGPDCVPLIMVSDWSGQHSSLAEPDALAFSKAGEQDSPSLCRLLSSPAAPFRTDHSLQCKEDRLV